jgi:hypothetical protein
MSHIARAVAAEITIPRTWGITVNIRLSGLFQSDLLSTTDMLSPGSTQLTIRRAWGIAVDVGPWAFALP